MVGELGSTDQGDDEYDETKDLITAKSAILRVINGETKSKPGGSFFKYTHKTKFDFTRYDIFKNDDEFNYDNNCLYIALLNGGLKTDKLEMLKRFVVNRVVPKCKLKDVCETLNISIKLTSINKDLTSRTENIGDKNNFNGEDHYNIGLVEEHYFIIEKTNITSYCINHYEDIQNMSERNKIYKYCKTSNKYKYSIERFISSYELVKLLLQNKDKLLETIKYDEKIMNTQFYDKAVEYSTLEYPNTCIEFKTFKSKETNDYYKIFFDFETLTNKTHKPYLVRYETEEGEKKEYIGETCAIDMLNDLPYKPNIMLIAHNANYDCRFLLQYLTRDKTLVKGSRILTCSGVFYRFQDNKQPINIKIKDSLKIINMPLRKFGVSFNLDVSKEIMPYPIYTQENINKVFVPISHALKHVSITDKQQFLNNIDKWNCRGNGHQQKAEGNFNILTYSSKYCEMDCSVLKKGYETFRSWMLEYTELDIDDYITLQSLSSDYKLKTGCYDNVAMLSGVCQHYISRCIVGGRCMTNSNKMYHVKRKLADFDACSLYPSAMFRMLGYLKGTPKVLNNLCYEFLKNQSGYFIRIKIKDVRKKLQFPLLSKFDEKGVRLFTNDMINEIIFIDKIGLEDAMKYQDIEYDIIDGYYFNEGHNENIKNVIKHLYSKRLELKKDKNPAQIVIKELMNSMYGKTILKPIETETVVKTIPEYEKYIRFNYNFIESAIKVGDKYYVKKIKCIINHFNYVQCGVEILSMSKRIMNEVMTLADENNLNIWYQDTDSMHIDYEQVEILAKLFKKEYKRNLIGEDMGQFHIDFNMDGAVDDIYAIEAYFIAKKVYIDVLESRDKNNELIQDNHIRLKSVPTSCIKHTCNKENTTPIELFKQLFNGDKIKFDLLEDGKKCGFKFEKDFSVRSYEPNKKKIKKVDGETIEYEESEFMREISFPIDKERIEIK